MGVVTLTRDDVVRELTRHCGDGRLTLDELEERIQEAYAATTDAELAHTLRELPRMDPPPAAATVESSPNPATTTGSTPISTPMSSSEPDDKPEVAFLGHMTVGDDKPEWEKAVGTLFAIGGFILLFNGMFWLALICWFVLPGLVLKHRKDH